MRYMMDMSQPPSPSPRGVALSPRRALSLLWRYPRLTLARLAVGNLGYWLIPIGLALAVFCLRLALLLLLGQPLDDVTVLRGALATAQPMPVFSGLLATADQYEPLVRVGYVWLGQVDLFALWHLVLRALALADQAACVIVPCSAGTLAPFLRDPRLRALIETVVGYLPHHHAEAAPYDESPANQAMNTVSLTKGQDEQDEQLEDRVVNHELPEGASV